MVGNMVKQMVCKMVKQHCTGKNVTTCKVTWKNNFVGNMVKQYSMKHGRTTC